MGTVKRCLGGMLLICLLWLGCQQSPQESMTAGQARVGSCDAAYDIAWVLSKEFQSVNRGAFIDVVRGTNREWLDSLINKTSEQAILDRLPSAAESLAFAQQKLRLLTYPVAYYPVYLLVDTANPVRALDSLTLRKILLGTISNWRDAGGDNFPIHIYVPLPGQGGWSSLQEYFGPLDSVVAQACSTYESMLDSAKGDKGALLFYGKPIDKLPYRKLRFVTNFGETVANVKQILEEPVYPFRLAITYVTTREKSDVAAGYLTYAVSNPGQKRVMNLGYRPASVPVRIIKMKGSS